MPSAINNCIVVLLSNSQFSWGDGTFLKVAETHKKESDDLEREGIIFPRRNYSICLAEGVLFLYQHRVVYSANKLKYTADTIKDKFGDGYAEDNCKKIVSCSVRNFSFSTKNFLSFVELHTCTILTDIYEHFHIYLSI